MSFSEKLNDFFGFDSFRQGQEEIVNALLDKRNVVAILPTGGGKSLCYQLPALISEGFSIVISPLIALMKDQVDSLNKDREVAAFINSTMDFSETEKVIRKIVLGQFKLLYLAPEKLESLKFAELLKDLKPNFLFVDEAHCISEWGHNFRPSYTKIKEFTEFCGIKKISAFTATATPEVVKDIIIQLNIKNPQIFVRGFERDSLQLNVLFPKNKKKKVLELISRHPGPAIIYTASRKNAEDISEFLLTSGVKCNYYHAGLSAPERRRIQEQFISGEITYIAATNAFGMGIDKSDIRLVIHYNIPGSIENYYQEIGRAGRDGKISTAYLLFDEKDLRIHHFFISNSHPDKKTILTIYKAICDYNQVAVASSTNKELIIEPEYISRYANAKVSKGLLHSAIRFLENSGYLKSISKLDKKDSVSFLYSSSQIKSFIKQSSNDEMKNLLLVLLRDYGNEIFNKSVKVSLSQLSSASGIEENELSNLLQILGNMGVVNYQPAIMKDTVLLIQPRADENSIKLNYKRINESFINAQKKLDGITEFVYSRECRFRFILNYFGENLPEYKCGKCDNCLLEEKISDNAIQYLSEIILETLEEAESDLTETALINLLRGRATKESFRNFSRFASCRNFDANEIKMAIHKLASSKKINRSPGRIKYLQLIQDKFNLAFQNKEQGIQAKNYEKDLAVFNSLKELRKKTSEKFLQSGNIICPDAVLREIVQAKPKNESQLLSIKGFNQRMFNKFGSEVLEVINAFVEKQSGKTETRNIPKNLGETYKMVQKKYSLQEIAKLQKISEAVVSMQVETIIEYDPGIDIDYLIEKKNYEEIIKEYKKGKTSLKELKQNLSMDISYPLLRIATAKIKFNSSL
jgi:ATP-dependent DNA helicase RecQ